MHAGFRACLRSCISSQGGKEDTLLSPVRREKGLQVPPRFPTRVSENPRQNRHDEFLVWHSPCGYWLDVTSCSDQWLGLVKVLIRVRAVPSGSVGGSGSPQGVGALQSPKWPRNSNTFISKRNHRDYLVHQEMTPNTHVRPCFGCSDYELWRPSGGAHLGS